jgi:hypothetical protein
MDSNRLLAPIASPPTQHPKQFALHHTGLYLSMASSSDYQGPFWDVRVGSIAGACGITLCGHQAA